MFQAAVDKEWSDKIRKISEPDQQSSARLLVFPWKISVGYQAKVDLRLWATESDVHLDDWIPLRNDGQTFQVGWTIVWAWLLNNCTSADDEDIEAMHDEDNIAVPRWPGVKMISNLQKGSSRHTQHRNNFEAWIKQVKEEIRKWKWIWDEMKAPHPIFSKFTQWGDVDQEKMWCTPF